MQPQSIPSTATVISALKQPESKSVIELVIAKIDAEDKFIPGKHISRDIKEKMAKGDAAYSGYRSGAHAQPMDEWFKSYDANRVKGSQLKLVAGSGPYEGEDVECLIKDIVFNPQLQIGRILAIGDNLKLKKTFPDHFDFCDYLSGMRPAAKYGKYHVDVIRKFGDAPKEVDNLAMPSSALESELTISSDEKTAEGVQQKRTILASLIPLSDNSSLDLDVIHDKAWVEKHKHYKRILWEHYQAAQSEPVFIHCSAGVGRTGHIILTFEIMKDYERIFASQDADKIAAEIYALVDRLRQTRPAFVATKRQLLQSIRNAQIVRQYGLEYEAEKQAKVQNDKLPAAAAVMTVADKQHTISDGLVLSSPKMK